MTLAAPPTLPSPADLQDAADLLRELQKVLGRLGTDIRREGGQFAHLMGQYKALGSDLHEARRRVAAAAPPPPPPARAAAGPGGVSALGTAVRLGRVPPRPAGSPPPSEPTPHLSVANPLPSGRGLERVQEIPPLDTPAAVEPAPLPMPRFISTLGPAGSRAINQGPEVRRLNRLLAALGFEVTQDRVYDVKTFRAVQEFQKERRLAVNGVVGLETRRELNQYVTGAALPEDDDED